MAKFTLHTKSGGYMHNYANTLKGAKKKCDKVSYDCIVCESYLAPSPWDKNLITKHGKEVYRNYEN